MGMKKRGNTKERRELTVRGEKKGKEKNKRRKRNGIIVPLPRNLNTTTLSLLSSLFSHLSSLPPALLPLSSPLLVTTATGEGQKPKGDEWCASTRRVKLKTQSFVLRRDAELLFGARVPLECALFFPRFVGSKA